MSSESTITSYTFEVPPEFAGEFANHATVLEGLAGMLKICPRDREEFWIGKWTEQKMAMNKLNDIMIKKYMPEFDESMVIVSAACHWLNNKGEVLVREKK